MADSSDERSTDSSIEGRVPNGVEEGLKHIKRLTTVEKINLGKWASDMLSVLQPLHEVDNCATCNLVWDLRWLVEELEK